MESSLGIQSLKFGRFHNQEKIFWIKFVCVANRARCGIDVVSGSCKVATIRAALASDAVHILKRSLFGRSSRWQRTSDIFRFLLVATTSTDLEVDHCTNPFRSSESLDPARTRIARCGSNWVMMIISLIWTFASVDRSWVGLGIDGVETVD